MELQKLFVALVLKADEFKQGLAAAGGQAEGFRGRVESVFARAGQAAKLAMAGIGVAVMAGFGMAVKSSIDVNSQLETTNLQFETLMGDADLAREHVAGLFEFAERTPFETGPIIDASLKLQTFGGAALNTQENMTLLGDAAAATNAPIDELGFWVGRLYANLEAGQPFGEAAARLQELAVMSPQARAEMEALQASGASAQEVFAYFQGDLEKFTGAMDKQAGTWSGMTSTIADQLHLLVADALKPFFETGKEGMAKLIKALSSPEVKQAIEGIGRSLEGLLDKTVTVFRGIGKEITNFGIAQGIKADLKELGFGVLEYDRLFNEIARSVNTGLFVDTEENALILKIMQDRIQGLYGAELEFIDSTQTARSEWEDWASDLSADRADVEAVTYAITGQSAAVMQWRLENVMASESTKTLDTGVQSLGKGVQGLTGYLSNEVRQLNEAEAALAAYSDAFRDVIEDYSTALSGSDNPLVSPGGWVTTITGGLEGEQLELLQSYQEEIVGLEETIANLESGLGTYGETQEEVNKKIGEARGELEYYQGLMAPLAAQTGVASTAQVGLKVNVEGVRQAVFDQLVQMGAAPEVITAYGLAIGVMTKEQAEAALVAATVKVKIEELAERIKGGMPVEAALADLDRFIDKIENGMITAAQQAATEIPKRIVEMKERVGEEALAAGQGLNNGLVQGIDETRQEAIEATGAVAEDVIANTRRIYGVESPSTVMIGIAHDLMAGLGQGLEERKLGLIQKAVGIGKALIDGVIAGIEGGKERLRGMLQGVADLIPDWLKEFLGIHSPAAATMPIGEAIVEGIVAGMEAQEYVITSAAYDLSQILLLYIGTVLQTGNELNVWFAELPDELQPVLLQIGELIAEGNAEVAAYFQAVIESGDALNIYLANVPEEYQEMVQEIGEILAEGMDDAISYVTGLEGLMENVGEILDVGTKFGNLGRGFAGHFERMVLDPMESQMAGLSEQIGAAGHIFEQVYQSAPGATFVDDGTVRTLDQLLRVRDRLATAIHEYQARGVDQAAYLFERQSLGVVEEAIDAFRLRNDINQEYLQQQERLYELEKARADLDFLKQQLELLELVRANNVPISVLQGVEFGLTADPGQLVDVMVDVTEGLVRRAQFDLNSLNQSPAVRTPTPGSTGGGTTMNVNTQNINGGQHIYVYDQEESVLEQWGVLGR